MKEPEWIVLAEDGEHMPLGSHPPDDEVLARLEGAFARGEVPGHTGWWLVHCPNGLTRRQKVPLVKIREIGHPTATWSIAADAFATQRKQVEAERRKAAPRRDDRSKANGGERVSVSSFGMMSRASFRLGFNDKLAGNPPQEQFKHQRDADLYEMGRLFAAAISAWGYKPPELPKPGMSEWQAEEALFCFQKAVQEGVWP